MMARSSLMDRTNRTIFPIDTGIADAELDL